ncbi:MAG: tRNA (N6-isopentenyl adenosine(37)-C2)-methylthiotransferase MiaB [Ezakiella sp.]|nr:tRNA (N6-isopentenyl adenosine(37)-C2)-methylthiotransferase MiaB [Ezakiella sp.]
MSKYIIKTYGCQMNEHDSEILSYTLESMGYSKTTELKDADLIIYNTCAVRKNAENKVYGNLGWLKGDPHFKDKIICVCGCMMQSEEIRNYILKTFENVNIIFGTNNIDKLGEYIDEYKRTGKTVVDIKDQNSYTEKTFNAIRPYEFKSFVNITYGCNNFCTFCIVPYTRGRERSRLQKDIVDEVKYLTNDGVKEIMLLGQNVNSYGKALKDGTNFAGLLKELNSIRELKRIRFMTPHPRDITDEFLECYGELDRLMPQLHLPVQSGSDKVLKDMNRHYDTDKYYKIVEKARKIRPDISFSTDIIVGYPTETEEDFEDTLDLVKNVKFDTSFTFIFSPRPHTPAANLKPLPDEIVKDRFNRLTEIMNQIQYDNQIDTIGKNFEVLYESYDAKANTIEGRNEYGRLVVASGNKDDIGKIITTRINNINTFTSYGEQIE